MHIITQKTLKTAWETYPDVERPLRKWFTEIKHLHFQNFAELKCHYPSADQVGRLTVFNIKGNHYRLVVRIEFEKQRVYIRSVMTHGEYDSNNWKNDEWFE